MNNENMLLNPENIISELLENKNELEKFKLETVRKQKFNEVVEENEKLKEVIYELNEALNHIDDNIMESCKNYDVNGIELKKILNKIKEN